MYNKSVLITGSSKGLGRELAIVFAENGYKVILHGRNKKRLNEVKDRILRICIESEICSGDLVKEKTIKNLLETAIKNDIDVLINNAGVYENSKNIIDINLKAPILLTKGIFEFFKKKKEGTIININSLAGKYYNSKESVYCASKFGLKGFMNSFRFEARKYNISIINVYLGALDTGIVAGSISSEEVSKYIFSLTKNYKTFQISNIEILRK